MYTPTSRAFLCETYAALTISETSFRCEEIGSFESSDLYLH